MNNAPRENFPKVSITLPRETLDAARRHANEMGRTLSNYVAWAVDRVNRSVEKREGAK